MFPLKTELILTTGLLFLLSTGIIWIRTANIKATYEFNQKEKELNHFKKTEQNLRIKLAKVSSPQRLKELSQNLNLSAPRLNQVYRFKENP